jgi:hypothetical protein
VVIGLTLALFALAGGLLYRARWYRLPGLTQSALTDDMVRQIEENGSIDVDEPLDLEQIQEEESRFWEEQPWDEAEEW